MAQLTRSDSNAANSGVALGFWLVDPFDPSQGFWQYVKFQFAPKVTSDNRRGSWEEKDVWGSEPLAYFKASSPRNIGLQITYILDGEEWTCETIKQQIKLIRGYFQRGAEGSRAQAKSMVVKLKLWCIGGSDSLTFRMRSCDVKYSDTMIANGYDTSSLFALRTDITLDLASWTAALGGVAGEFRQIGNAGDERPLQDFRGLDLSMPGDWF